MRERDVARAVVSLLRDTLGGHVWSTEQGYRRDSIRVTAGIPDLIVMFPEHGVWTFVELKGPKGRLRSSQKTFRDSSRSCDCPWQLWRSAEDAMEWCLAVGIITKADT